MESNNLILKNVKLLFIELNDKDFGSSITIDVTDEKIRKEIEQFYTSEGLTPKFKDYTNAKSGESTKQYSVKLASFAEFRDEDDKSFNIDNVNPADIKLGFGAEINVVIRPYKYDNKFGAGKSASATAIRVVKGADIKSDMSLI